MWLIKEDGHELQIKGIPLIRWLIAAGLITGGIYYAPGFAASLLRGANFGDEPGNFIFYVGALLFFPIAFIVALYFSPLTISTFNREHRTVTSKTIAVTGLQTNRFNYTSIDGGIRIDAGDDDEGGRWFSPYLRLRNGDQVDLCAVSSPWESEIRNMGAKINEFLEIDKELKIREVNPSDDMIKLDLSE